MKNYLLLFIGVLLIAGTACEETVDIKAEKEAIIALIKAEKEAYLNQDMESLKIYNLQDSSYFFMYSSENNFYAYRGYDDQAEGIKEAWENWDPDVKREFDFKVVELKIFPQCAWAVVKVMWKYTRGEESMETKGIETIFFEKVEGKWKIAGQSVVGASSYDEEEAEDEAEDEEEAEGETESE